MTRRTLLSLPAAAAFAAVSASAQKPSTSMAAFVRRNDEVVESYLERQNTDPDSRWRGSLPDSTGLHQPGSASGVLARGVAAYVHPESKYHRSKALRQRLELAIEHMERVQTPDGNFDLLITNFNSPPDTAFITRNLAAAAWLSRHHGAAEIFERMTPLLKRCGEGLVNGGVHTPNHRWVMCAALAQLHDLFPNEAAYKARIDEWLMETIDIDADGQYSEQSTTVYNAIVNDCLVTIAKKLQRPELLEPVRRNLDAMMYLLHDNYEVVTEISHRQDRGEVGHMGPYWFCLRAMAREDNNGKLETLVRHIEPDYSALGLLLEYPELQQEGPTPEPVPDDYVKSFPHSRLAHVRRGKTSAMVILEDNSRFFAVRRGGAVVEGLRFASAFFGKGQFRPQRGVMRDGASFLEQDLEAAYYQPFGDGRTQPWGVGPWYELRPRREATEINRIQYRAEVHEKPNGFDVRMVAEGVDWIPYAIEVNLRPGGKLSGVAEGPSQDAFLLKDGYATYTLDGDTLRFGPGVAETEYVQVRGAEPKLPGPSVYLTGYTPLDRVLEFRW